MSSSTVNIPAPLQLGFTTWLSTRFPDAPSRIGIRPLAGDGSTRQFFRAVFESHSWVLLWEPGWNLSKDYAAHQRYLENQGIAVPRFEAVFPDPGFLIMEDLGDELLQSRILTGGGKDAWLMGAVELLAHLHGRCHPVPPEMPAAGRRFDREKFGQELNYTEEHLCRGLLHLKEAAHDVASYCAVLESLGPQVFCHRDYHTRNILVHGDRLALIDFQDARMGSPHYDVASLIYDPYVPTTPAERKTLVDHYQSVLRQYPVGGEVVWEEFDRGLHLVGYQRLVKAAGSFASFFTRQGKSTHLPYLLPALRQARALASDEPGLQGLFDLDLWIDLLEGMEAESL